MQTSIMYLWAALFCLVMSLEGTFALNTGITLGNEEESVQQHQEPPPKIKGGLRVQNRTLAPWMAHISSDNAVCGGSLISNQVILTTASCVAASRSVSAQDPIFKISKTITYSLGGLTTIQGDESSTGEIQGTLKDTKNGVKVHPGYSYPINNLALVRMLTEVSFTEYISPITLAAPLGPSPWEVFSEGYPVTILGWGVTEDADKSEDLLFVETTMRSTDICEYFWDCPNSPTYFDHGFHVCYAGQAAHGRCYFDA
ncbi:unnamed protein product [Notodromas monacha]|uniref:Peptidase S1 domain-containing protein n=1 Tax=Notodromas monacha TaxID=399045 RepID=A0A7R9C0C5_9CRUS|nr:unnamed protein product [Notodromas monacha]CAG0923813.1 unnamed protein product [Notodromas monacha]